ncbi:MAG: hypothetical protein CM15mP118_3800 [Alphaproteobacteria bacterium]|nr:MAG: hypothetical protein CM15mP118_3800 [Alphaproteobacteria bacterium]
MIETSSSTLNEINENQNILKKKNSFGVKENKKMFEEKKYL